MRERERELELERDMRGEKGSGKEQEWPFRAWEKFRILEDFE